MIDVTFDDRTDAKGKDPDAFSPTLKRHHKELWSKVLPSGEAFELKEEPGFYLVYRSSFQTIPLSSDSISNSLRSHKRLAHVIGKIPADHLDEFQRLGSTIGAKMLFPANKVDGNLTINVERGFNSKIKDRFDLTLECIRRHYSGEASPLSNLFARYADFFDLFSNFNGYVEFFLLHDLVDQGRVKFFIPFDEQFSEPTLPTNIEEYLDYMESTIAFVEARNKRIMSWVSPS